jgi:hypothetical protein
VAWCSDYGYSGSILRHRLQAQQILAARSSKEWGYDTIKLRTEILMMHSLRPPSSTTVTEVRKTAQQ